MLKKTMIFKSIILNSKAIFIEISYYLSKLREQSSDIYWLCFSLLYVVDHSEVKRLPGEWQRCTMANNLVHLWSINMYPLT